MPEPPRSRVCFRDSVRVYSAAEVTKAWAGPALRRCKGSTTNLNESHDAAAPDAAADADLSLADLFERAVASLPYDPELAPVEIVSHEVRRFRQTSELEIVIDREGGVDIDLSERVARKINARLAERTELYTLQVASAGLERPLVKPGDYERFREKNVRVLTTLAIENRKTHRGRLLGVRGNAVVIDLDRTGRELQLPIELIKSANLEYDPRADLTRDKRERKHGDKNR